MVQKVIVVLMALCVAGALAFAIGWFQPRAAGLVAAMVGIGSSALSIFAGASIMTGGGGFLEVDATGMAAGAAAGAGALAGVWAAGVAASRLVVAGARARLGTVSLSKALRVEVDEGGAESWVGWAAVAVGVALAGVVVALRGFGGHFAPADLMGMAAGVAASVAGAGAIEGRRPREKGAWPDMPSAQDKQRAALVALLAVWAALVWVAIGAS